MRNALENSVSNLETLLNGDIKMSDGIRERLERALNFYKDARDNGRGVDTDQLFYRDGEQESDDAPQVKFSLAEESYERGVDVDYTDDKGERKTMRLHTPASEIEALKPTKIEKHSLTRDEQKKLYQSFKPETNSSTGEKVDFYHSAFGKNHREDGLFEKIVPQIRELFKKAELIYSEPEQLAGTLRKDATTHKEHRDVVGYGNYLNKVEIDGKEYYVRFTVQRKKNESGLHSSFVSNVELYENDNPIAVAYGPSSNGGRRLDYDRITDVKLKTYFEKSKEFEEKNGDIRFSIGEDAEDILNDKSLGLRERLTAIAASEARENGEDKALRNLAVNAIGGNLADLRKAMGKQRQYDRTTVKPHAVYTLQY